MVEETIWSVETEINFFHALKQHKPIGIFKHFNMSLLMEKFAPSGRSIGASEVWSHLDTLYDVSALNENEVLPESLKAAADFDLPESDFGSLLTHAHPRFEHADDEAAKSGGKQNGGDDLEAADSPKRDTRKRTRQSASGTTPSEQNNKRPRRT